MKLKILLGLEVGRAALAGGTMAFGTYHLSSYIGWKFQGGNKMGDLDISYRQYTTMQADFQRSRFWGKEYGGYLIEGGGVHRVSSGTSTQIDMGATPNGAFAEYHTHWDKPNITRVINLDGNYINKSTHTGMAADIKTHRYHSPIDMTYSNAPFEVLKVGLDFVMDSELDDVKGAWVNSDPLKDSMDIRNQLEYPGHPRYRVTYRRIHRDTGKGRYITKTESRNK